MKLPLELDLVIRFAPLEGARFPAFIPDSPPSLAHIQTLILACSFTLTLTLTMTLTLTLACSFSPAAEWAVELCQACWDEKTLPQPWHVARAASIFKKGDESDCGNYRPISLLAVGYKIFAAVPLAYPVRVSIGLRGDIRTFIARRRLI